MFPGKGKALLQPEAFRRVREFSAKKLSSISLIATTNGAVRSYKATSASKSMHSLNSSDRLSFLCTTSTPTRTPWSNMLDFLARLTWVKQSNPAYLSRI